MDLNINEIKVKNRIRDDLGDLTSLKESITTFGLLSPIIVNTHRELITGERRLRACKELGMTTISAIIRNTFDDIAMALKAERDENTCRKDFTIEEMVRLAAKIRPYEEAAAKKRQKEAGKNHGKGKPIASENVSEAIPAEANRSRKRIADVVGISAPTLKKAELVVDATKHEDPK